MKDLSMHIMDIVQNSVRAKAENITLSIVTDEYWLTIKVQDDGKGMDEVTLQKVRDPFYTSRTTRKVGMGIPLIQQNAELTGGHVEIESTLGVGTTLTAQFGRKHIDRPPMGDIASTAAMMMTGNEGVNLQFEVQCGDEQFAISTNEVKEVLGDVDIRLPKVTSFLKEMIEENLRELKIEFD
ncbi:sensor histidine kinase [Carboxylicivirga sediminis]|uniref:histidine kinase n=1 Tax=Carboxylicivirga sediminis TaxID=2006564 RepID=A0A941F0L4_9BACT|nr:sensor histidine kinase [Carboxylicivirga sediminis]MBR8534139.1 sensor histidine kinase [Carboxylicivirga sediminis]